MRYHRRSGVPRRRRTAGRTMRVLRQLCADRARLTEEVKQLSAAVAIYKELAQRAREMDVMEQQAA
jgi:hypothetical protein